MSLDLSRKICVIDHLGNLARQYHEGHQAIVLCHGCFDIVHPGHLRYLQFARSQGDVLIVSLTGDDAIEKADGTRPYITQNLRAETLAALELVDHVVIADGPTAEPVIQALEPDVYIKGKEYQHSTHPGFLAEKQLVEGYGGKVIYSSGEVVFSSTELLDRLGESMESEGFHGRFRLAAWCGRWNINAPSMSSLLHEGFAGKRVAVVGDAIRDHYVFCDPANVAGEAPILSVRPLEEASYLGGASIIAAHLKAMGAQPHLVTTIGWDDASSNLIADLEQRQIECTTYPTRRQLPTKRRYLVENQKLLKVDQATPQPLDTTTQRKMVDLLVEMAPELDAIIFADFGYGTVTSNLLEEALPVLRPQVKTIAGDVSGAQLTLLAYHNADLLTPSERELRSVVGDFEQSLPTVAFSLMKKLHLANLTVTMGHHGSVLFRPREDNPDQWFTSRLRSEYLPCLAAHATDPLGAGDAFLAAATLALCSDATLPQAGYIASAAAAIQVTQIGNQPVSAGDLNTWLHRQPNLLEPTIIPPSDQPALSMKRS